MRLGVRLAASSIWGLAFFGVLLFLPAGTFNYWQAWVFITVFTVATAVPSVYLARTDPAALQRRMEAGPLAEARGVQKILVVAAFSGLFGMIAFSAFDHRHGWSAVPAWLSLIGDVLLATGLCLGQLVIVQNSYAAASVRVEAGQTLTSSGLYALVRHPMYAADLIMMVGIPLALGSYWGLLFILPGLAVLVLRILDEEKMLTQELDGYREYTQRVRYRLLPYVW
jgi:protein-S-isoprenylcysteine O-methyltransferase Ste14